MGLARPVTQIETLHHFVGTHTCPCMYTHTELLKVWGQSVILPPLTLTLRIGRDLKSDWASIACIPLRGITCLYAPSAGELTAM